MILILKIIAAAGFVFAIWTFFAFRNRNYYLNNAPFAQMIHSEGISCLYCKISMLHGYLVSGFWFLIILIIGCSGYCFFSLILDYMK